MQRIVDVHERLPMQQMIPLGIQHLFAMFGATVLVPLLTGLDPAVALFTSGAGTLLFILITKGKVPAYLGSSFAFIVPIQFISAQYGIEYALGGTVAVGLLYAVVAGIVVTTSTRSSAIDFPWGNVDDPDLLGTFGIDPYTGDYNLRTSTTFEATGWS